MNRLAISLLFAVSLFPFDRWASDAAALITIPHVSIDEIKAHPETYDGKIVQVEGWLASGHLGVFLYDSERRSSLRLRPAEEVPSLPPEIIHHDDLLKKLWKISENAISGLRSREEVTMQVLVRVLNERGEKATKFEIFGQFPTELVPVRVLNVSFVQR